MTSIYLRDKFRPEDIQALRKEFPHYSFLFDCEEASEWESVEILYGSRLSAQELELTSRLKWIHSPTADTEGLCIEEIKNQGNILLTLSKGQNVFQIAEFVIGGILTFAKQFNHWPQAYREPSEFRDWPLKETMWTMQKKTLLQIGLGEVGNAIVKMANRLGMKSWGIRRERSFHPYCHKTFGLADLHSLLPHADVVVLALPKRTIPEMIFDYKEFQLMKNDSIFIVVGSADYIKESSLIRVGKTGKFRGILLDAFSHLPKSDSPLWDLPNMIMTPSVSSYPESEENLAFRIFRKNLRLFVPGKISEMKNLVASKRVFIKS